MVTIVSAKEQHSLEGKVFVSLEVQGDVKIVESQNGKFYLTANKTRIPTSFPIGVCQALIGKQLPGTVEKVSCEPYEYVNKDSGETVILDYTYTYSPEEESNSKQSNPMFPNYEQAPFMHTNQIPLGMIQNVQAVA